MTTAVERTWETHRRWSAAADRSHAMIERRRHANLVLLVLGAISGSAATMVEGETGARIAALTAGAALGIAALLQQRIVTSSQVERWLTQRRASEQLKAAVLRSVALGTAGESAPDEELDALVEEVQSAASAAIDSFADVRPGDVELRFPGINSFQDYVTKRAEGQATWHETQRVRLRDRARWWRYGELAATLIGGGLSLWAGAFNNASIAPATAACTTIAATLAAHLGAARYEQIAARYAATSERLARAVARLDPNADNARRAQFVDEVEGILAQQNEAWQELLSAK